MQAYNHVGWRGEFCMAKKRKPVSAYEILSAMAFMIVPTIAAILLMPAALPILFPTIVLIGSIWMGYIAYRDEAYKKERDAELALLAPYNQEEQTLRKEIRRDDRIFSELQRKKVLELYDLKRTLHNYISLKRVLTKQKETVPILEDMDKRIPEIEKQLSSCQEHWSQSPERPERNNEVDNVHQMHTFIGSLKKHHSECLRQSDQALQNSELCRTQISQKLHELQNEEWYRQHLRPRG